MRHTRNSMQNQILISNLAFLVREARIEQRYSMPQLGEAVGLSRQHIADIEHGRRPQVSFAVVMRLAEVLDFSLDSLKQTVLS